MAIRSNPPIKSSSSIKRGRKSRSKKQPIHSLWLIGAGALGCLVGLVLYIRLFSVPWAVGNQVSREVRLLESQLNERRRENARLQEKLDYLSSRSGLEALARSRGYHHPGEQVYLYPNKSVHTP